jgi:UPF0755 protein
MTLRNGGSPRTGRGRGVGDTSSKVPVLDKGWDGYEPDLAQTPDPSDPRNRRKWPKLRKSKTPPTEIRRNYRSNRSAGLGGLLRFGLFALLLGGLVVGGLWFIARPAIVKGVVDFSAENPTALRLPFVADLVRSELSTSLTVPVKAGDTKEVPFIVSPGDTPQQIADQLYQSGLIRESRAFVFQSIETGLGDKFQAGRHVLTKSMTLDEIMTILAAAPVAPPYVTMPFPEGMRIEQMIGLMEKWEANPSDPTAPLTLDVGQFYRLAENPPSYLLADFPWLKLPAGASLEGFLFPATYTVAPDITPEQLIRQMLAAFADNAPKGLLDLPPAQLFQTVQIAALVEKEAAVDSERAMIAGVYTNRLNPKIWPTGLLDADPTLNYGNDSVWLENPANPMSTWVNYAFFESIQTTGPLGKVVFPEALAPYNTYAHKGLPPSPICSSGAASLLAAMTPNTATGYLFFLAKNDGSHTHAFAKTQKEQDANAKKYGYLP